MSTKKLDPEPKLAPQIDFREAFSAAEPPAGFPCSPPAIEMTPKEHPIAVAPSSSRYSRFGQSEWTNILFTLIAVFGGFCCAFLFFNGVELLRTATGWPREFLYARSSTIASGKIDNVHFVPTHPSAESTSTSSGDGAPFAHSAAPLQGLNQSPFTEINAPPAGVAATSAPSISGNPSAPVLPPSILSPGPNPGSVLDRLGLPAPGGDALLQVLNKAASNLERAALLDGHRTVVVIKTTVSRTRRRSLDSIRNVTQTAQNAVAEVKAQVGSPPKNSLSHAGTQVATVQGQAANALRSTTVVAQSALGGVAGTRGGIGPTALAHGGALGGLGVGGTGTLGGIGGGIHLPGGRGGGGGRH